MNKNTVLFLITAIVVLGAGIMLLGKSKTSQMPYSQPNSYTQQSQVNEENLDAIDGQSIDTISAEDDTDDSDLSL